MSRRRGRVATVAVVGALLLAGCTDAGDESDVTLIETTPDGTPLPSVPTS